MKMGEIKYFVAGIEILQSKDITDLKESTDIKLKARTGNADLTL